MQKTIPVEYDELVLLLDSWLNYQAMLRVFYEDEYMSAAKRRIIKANWENVPEESMENTIACAEHIIEKFME